MKTAQELRAGNVIMIGTDPMVVVKAEYNKSGQFGAAAILFHRMGLRRHRRHGGSVGRD